MHQEHNNLGRVETRPETPPLTPVSANPTLSSQTSTGKSGYSRKFNQKWLATPSSTGTGSPVSKKEPSPQSPPKSPSPVSPTIGSMPSSPNVSPSRPVPVYLPHTKFMAPSHVEQSQTMASSHHDHTIPFSPKFYYTQTFEELPSPFRGVSSSFEGVSPPFGGTSPHLGGHRLSTNPFDYHASNLSGPNVVHHATFQASPSPHSNTSPP